MRHAPYKHQQIFCCLWHAINMGAQNKTKVMFRCFLFIYNEMRSKNLTLRLHFVTFIRIFFIMKTVKFMVYSMFLTAK